jgi:hypothetical protein
VEDGMLWRNGCDGKVLRCGAGKRHQQPAPPATAQLIVAVLIRAPVAASFPK